MTLNDLNKYIPPLHLNYNSGLSESDYYKHFSLDYQRFFFPEILALSMDREIQTGCRPPRILDIGCGFAPMAHAFVIALTASKALFKYTQFANDERNKIYCGIDIRLDAISWLKSAYADHTAFTFHHHQAPQTVDYVGEFIGSHARGYTNAESDGKECRFDPAPFKADIQWSSSFFTHLTSAGASEALKFISKNIGSDGISVNSWLIVDTASCVSMYIGDADRTLSIDTGPYLTYSAQNPLVCTAYKLNVVGELYEQAGLTIKKIIRGSWRGNHVKNSFNHYQDIVIAQKTPLIC
jgi:hypothetical protein